MALTKASLVDKISSQMGIKKHDSTDLLEGVIAIIKSTLETGESLKISGFGTFDVRQKKDRKGRNPATGESLIIEARKIVTFKPSKMLNKKINASDE